jgi:hypothetical protein
VDGSMPPMDVQPQGDLQLTNLIDSSVSRRRFLRGAALTGGGLLAAGIAACVPVAIDGCRCRRLGPSRPCWIGRADDLPGAECERWPCHGIS